MNTCQRTYQKYVALASLSYTKKKSVILKIPNLKIIENNFYTLCLTCI